MLDNYTLKAITASIGIASLTAPIGSLLIWKRSAYFGDALSHAALLGVALSLFYQWPVMVGSILIAVIFAFLLVFFKNNYSNDTLLAIFSHSSLALAIIIISLGKNFSNELSSYLFGDILAICKTDIYIIVALIIIAYIWLYFRWQALLLLTISEDLASIEGMNVQRINLEFLLLTSIAIACIIKIIGSLLIAALLTIPAAAASRVSINPKQMISITFIISCLAIFIGLFGAIKIDLPAGAAIIIASAFLLITSNFIATRSRE